MHLKSALSPMGLPRSRAIAETRVDTWDEIEDREKTRERRGEARNRAVAANLPPKFGGPSQLCLHTESNIGHSQRNARVSRHKGIVPINSARAIVPSSRQHRDSCTRYHRPTYTGVNETARMYLRRFCRAICIYKVSHTQSAIFHFFIMCDRFGVFFNRPPKKIVQLSYK